MPKLHAPTALPAPASRTLAHTRQTTFRGYHRADGNWDIEAVVTDTKTYELVSRNGDPVAPGEPVHDMTIRMTVDSRMNILAIATSMDYVPFAECGDAASPMQKFVGQTMGPGWRNLISQLIGGIGGCTHLRELLFNMATIAYQTIPSYRAHLRGQRGEPDRAATKPPPLMGQCMSWDPEGPVVKRIMPQFAARNHPPAEG